VPAAFLDIAAKPQVSNGWARCTAVALSDISGAPRSSFQQGQVAVFHYEFEVLQPMGAVIGGVVLRNDKGVIVHGKNSWQYDEADATVPQPGTRVRFSQEVALELGVGEYVFEVGLAAVTEADWRNRGRISHADMDGRHARVCHMPDVGAFSVTLAMRDGVPKLTHHGVADLPGRMRVDVVAAASPASRTAQAGA
jgi:lipopolysaccharide transport system ATP-binding protein